MGGLISRYMLEKIGLPAGVTVDLCALVAVPHLGAPVALQNLLGLRPEIFLSASQCREALVNPEFPSAYQLLPHPDVPALLRQSAETGFVVADLAAAPDLGLVADSLQAARDLAAGLPMIGPGFQPPCRYIAIAGNAQKTITNNYLQPGTALPVTEPTAGDGTVPLWSAAPPGIPVRYVVATHGSMFSDKDTIAMLQAVLRPGQPGGRLFSLDPDPAQTELAVEPIDHSVAPGATFSVSVIADRPTDHVDAVVEVERLFPDGRRETDEVQVHYLGGLLRSIPLECKAPGEQGVVTFAVRSNGAASASPQKRAVLVIASRAGN